MQDNLDYNQLDNIDKMVYKIIEVLMLENENLWKLLKYNTPDALSPSKPNLTIAEKRAMIYAGQEDSSKFNVFTDSYFDDAVTDVISQIRIFPDYITPKNHIQSIVDIGFQVVVHNKLGVLEDNTNRKLLIFKEIVKTLNGAQIGGISSLRFDKKISANCKAVRVDFSKFFSGYVFGMSVYSV